METNISSTIKSINDEGYVTMMKGPVTMVNPNEVAQTVLFLASDASSTVSGSCIATDLGYAAMPVTQGFKTMCATWTKGKRGYRILCEDASGRAVQTL
jgi:enoyl-[acyl-carrier-protein] reductase (NADH)